MKKAATAFVVFLVLMTAFLSLDKEESAQAMEPSVSDEQEAAANKEDEETKEGSRLPLVDTSLELSPGMKIAAVSKSTKGEFWELVKKGMEEMVASVNEAYGFQKEDAITMTFEGPADESDVEGQINILDAVIAENPDVLCISAGDMDSCQAQLETAKENGIPVIAFDSNVSNTKMIRAFCGSDNTRVGEIGAYRLASAIDESGKVAVFSGQEKTQSAKVRTQGFLKYMEKYEDIEVVQVIYADQVEDMAAAMTGVLNIYPKLEGVFCTNAEITELYLDMEKARDKDSIAVVGVDATTRQQEAIRNGQEVGTVSQQPYVMGGSVAWTALLAASGDEEARIQRKTLLEPAWIDGKSLENEAYGDYIYKG
ncbi:MAG: substrate-binding domain-containing protein [Eubacteriales bacterium]|nr:substrate-binding domain-containing protein [Eubacteriales bacterium]